MSSLFDRILRRVFARSSIGTCPNCGTTVIKYDPSVKLDVDEACSVMKPGTYATGSKVPVPYCILAKGHDGDHWDLIDYEESWS